MQQKTSDRKVSRRAQRVFDALALFKADDLNPTSDELSLATGIERDQVVKAISECRSSICESLGLAIVCARYADGKHRFRLTDVYEEVLDPHHPDVRDWVVPRITFVESELCNAHRAVRVALAIVDKRTKVGKKVVKVNKHVTRLMEDLREIEDEGVLA